MRRTIAIQVDDADFVAQYEQRLKESGLSLKKWLVGLMQADIASHSQTQEMETAPEPILTVEESAPGVEAPTLTAESNIAIAEQVAAVIDTPEQSTETLNLFVKITREQREALDALKNETGETIGSVLKRVVGEFLGHVRDGSIPEDFDATYQYYDGIAQSCDSKCSAIIPAQSGNELAAYLEISGRSRNVLMSSLVHLELYGQEQTQDMAYEMSM